MVSGLLSENRSFTYMNSSSSILPLADCYVDYCTSLLIASLKDSYLGCVLRFLGEPLKGVLNDLILNGESLRVFIGSYPLMMSVLLNPVTWLLK